MNKNRQYILIVATSARMLAQAARIAGLKPLVIAIYADQDIRDCVEEIQQIPSFHEDNLIPVIDELITKYAVEQVVYGSGFEKYLDSLKGMANRLTVYGNQPDVFAKLQDKPKFFASLNKLGIPFPEVAFDGADWKEGWLVKPMQAQGGIGIRRCKYPNPVLEASYYQKYQVGIPHSVLFLADGKRSQIVGFNRQWTIALNNDDEFIFSGIINYTVLSAQQKAKIAGWLDQLVLELSLKGLNSLDFIQNGEASYLLEINPRPSASMQLYDADLFNGHINACREECLDNAPKLSQLGYTAYQIVYATQKTHIPQDFNWPENVVDLPMGGSLISEGQPICSMIMQGKEPDWVLQQLQTLQENILNKLNRFKTHGI